MHVYVDESGDLGFSEKSTKFFVVAYVVCNSSTTLETNMKRVLKKLHTKGQYHFSRNELKFSRMSADCRKAVLEKICQCDVDIGVVVVKKSLVKTNLREDLTVLYNWLLVHHIMSALVPRLEAGERIHIVFDKSLTKRRILSFNEYLKNKVSYLSYREGNEIQLERISCDHVDSEREPCLQAADAVAGAYFQKHEKGDDQYTEIIKNQIRSFRYLW